MPVVVGDNDVIVVDGDVVVVDDGDERRSVQTPPRQDRATRSEGRPSTPRPPQARAGMGSLPGGGMPKLATGGKRERRRRRRRRRSEEAEEGGKRR